TLHGYLGGWPEYVRAREDRAREATAAKAARSAKAQASPKAKRPPRATNAKEQERLEREIEEAEAVLKSLADELADPSAWSTAQRMARATARHEQAKRAVDKLYLRWERIAG